MNQNLLLLSIIFFAVSCASSGLKERDVLRKLVVQKDFTEAQELLKNSEFYKKERNQLLFFLEKGMIHHLAGEFEKSALDFEQAKVVHQKLYTKSISKKAATFLTNDSTDNYYGQIYERSLLHFYQALNHFILYQQGDAKKLRAARAELLAWDSYMESIRTKRLGRTVFKQDLLAKTFGAFIHESLNTSADDQIALQLYKDAKRILLEITIPTPALILNMVILRKIIKNFISFLKKL